MKLILCYQYYNIYEEADSFEDYTCMLNAMNFPMSRTILISWNLLLKDSFAYSFVPKGCFSWRRSVSGGQVDK